MLALWIAVVILALSQLSMFLYFHQKSKNTNFILSEIQRLDHNNNLLSLAVNDLLNEVKAKEKAKFRTMRDP